MRERLGLPGSKNACEQGECGSCSVLLDGKLVCACLVLAAQAEGHELVTVEGLAEDSELHPVQAAFNETGAVQCGFSAPGFIVATVDLLARPRARATTEIGRRCRATSAAAPAASSTRSGWRQARDRPFRACPGAASGRVRFGHFPCKPSFRSPPHCPVGPCPRCQARGRVPNDHGPPHAAARPRW